MAARLIHKDFVGAYVYLIKVDGVVRYVGKGRRYRAIDHLRVIRVLNERRAKGEKVKALLVHNRLAKASRNGAEIKIEILVNKLSDQQAYQREIEEISGYPKGQLWNIHKGGSGGDADMMRRIWSDPEFRERCIAASKQGRSRPEVIERARQTALKYWNDPEFYQEQVAKEKARWADPEYRRKRIGILQKVWADPDRSARKSALTKSQWTPERRAAMSENRRKAWSDPEFKKRASESIRKSRKTMKPRPKCGPYRRSMKKSNDPTQLSMLLHPT